jgi:hypothetical protein
MSPFIGDISHLGSNVPLNLLGINWELFLQETGDVCINYEYINRFVDMV